MTIAKENGDSEDIAVVGGSVATVAAVIEESTTTTTTKKTDARRVVTLTPKKFKARNAFGGRLLGKLDSLQTKSTRWLFELSWFSWSSLASSLLSSASVTTPRWRPYRRKELSNRHKRPASPSPVCRSLSPGPRLLRLLP